MSKIIINEPPKEDVEDGLLVKYFRSDVGYNDIWCTGLKAGVIDYEIPENYESVYIKIK